LDRFITYRCLRVVEISLLLLAKDMNLLAIAARIAAQTAEEEEGLMADAPPVISQQEQQGYIKKTPGKGYCVKSEKNSDWSGGCYPSKGKAKKRLQQVEQFKHMKK
jgi:hypothetical protein